MCTQESQLLSSWTGFCTQTCTTCKISLAHMCLLPTSSYVKRLTADCDVDSIAATLCTLTPVQAGVFTGSREHARIRHIRVDSTP